MMRGERMAKKGSLGNMVLKKLSDITNLQAAKIASQEEKPLEISECDKNFVDQLIRERMTLMKLVDERNKIIELSGAELQKHRVGLQKLQLQNWNLAQSNSKMLAELNLGREKVKALQHELICKDALLKAKRLGQEGEKAKGNCQKTCSQSQEGDEADLDIDCTDEKPRNQNRRRLLRSRSLGSSTTCQKAEEKETVEIKRRRLRKQSVRFKSHWREPKENLFEIEDAKFPSSQAHHDNRVHSSLEESCVRSQRSSIGRPLRKAAEKVQSYREVPLNMKMRRNE
ncbi:shugoshin-1-like isoform X2 [Humulus lupulus]|uniref:shugoshin-1-like isoform X2 n=1 Tax=Humulus lupulus TaxID=3486 RepID=UPI002B40E32A|nr:shugoshin-1-like isoform X2 [Humulus lupulus]